MFDEGLVEPDKLRELFERVQDQLVRYPAIDPDVLRERFEAAVEAQ